ncbi:flagellin N-terminal helical domain-containing protein [Pararhodospirillum oryzae]|uniref:Flagellin n=1 Tax=Pararhodospirillum oryzae TaxID=478448 RepID=A0A512H4G6_9PROT|nr:flagellin [Pararhodospirillum oryzae]GEO80342.1 hypothetical protein ROR02_04730 [Pararhodospirillum oryzae]
MPVITTNTAANSALRYLNINQSDQTTALNRIASGSKITSASDDAAGLAVSMKLQNDTAVLNQAQTNASHASAMLETADGAMSEIADILERMKVLATSSLSGAVESERANIDAEYQQLISELNDIAANTEFNGTALLDGTYTGSTVEGKTTYVDTATESIAGGASIAAGDTITLTYDSKTIEVTATGGATSIQSDIDAALNAAGYEAGAIKASINTTALVLTEQSTDSKLTAASATIGGSAATVTHTAAVAASKQSTLTLNAGLTGADSNLTAGDKVSFDVNGTTVSFEIANASGGTAPTTASIQTQLDAALTEAGVSANLTATYDATTGSLEIETDAGDTVDLSNGVFTDKDSSSHNSTLDFMVGTSSADIISVSIADMRTSELGASSGTALSSTSVDTSANATKALDVLDAAVADVAEARATLGAQMSRFEYRSDSLATTEENLDAAQSAITDADVAEEQANLSSAQVLTNAAIAALSQANEMPQDLMRLFN